jgi:hypothetical protein
MQNEWRQWNGQLARNCRHAFCFSRIVKGIGIPAELAIDTSGTKHLATATCNLELRLQAAEKALTMNQNLKLAQAHSPEDQNREWKQELADAMPPVPLRPWKEPDYNAARQAVIGLLLGGIAGCTSLLFNVVGSVLWPAISGESQHPLRLIQVYLTFPLGESALQLNSGAALALGCVLYLGTGMLYGMLFQLVLSYWLPFAGVWARISTCGFLSVLVWAVNYFAVLLWLQPLLFGKSWIVDLIPNWVAVLTHLVFGLTIALLYPFGERRARRHQRLTTSVERQVRT